VMVISIKEDVYDEIYIAEVAVDIVDKDVFRMRWIYLWQFGEQWPVGFMINWRMVFGVVISPILVARCPVKSEMLLCLATSQPVIP